MEAKKQIDIIRETCKKKGLKIYTVFRKAEIPIQTIANWDKKEPEAFQVLEKINATIEQMEAEKLAEALAESEQL